MSDSFWPHGLYVACQASASITNSEFAQTYVHWVDDDIQLSPPLLPLLLPSIFASIRVFSTELAPCIRWPKYWSLSISPSNEYSWLISFRIGCFDFLAVQGTVKSLLQHHNSKAFMVQLLHLYITTGKTTALTKYTFVGKVISAF